MIEIVPLAGIGEIVPGDDLALILLKAMKRTGIEPRKDDILIVTQKIVSKAEGRFVDLRSVIPGLQAVRLAAMTLKDPRLVELVLRESTSIVRAVPNVLITRHRLGHVMANAGVDRSNIGGGDSQRALLLPVDPDASAAAIGRALDMAVVISDSFGRPWRVGVVGVAIGAFGVTSLHDRRGETDRDGRVMEVTQIALGDILATAALLVTGEGAEGIPAALIRGFPKIGVSRPASDLVRPLEEDLFR